MEIHRERARLKEILVAILSDQWEGWGGLQEILADLPESVDWDLQVLLHDAEDPGEEEDL